MGLTFSLISGGCAVYKMDIQQGNVVDMELREKLKLGMTKKQVIFILGSPMLQDPFHKTRWDYFYFFKPGYGEIEKHGFSVYFDSDKLSRIEDIPFQIN